MPPAAPPISGLFSDPPAGGGGQPDREAATPLVVIDGEVAVVALHQPLGDGQPQATAGLAGGGGPRHPGRPPRTPRTRWSGRDAPALVDHREQHAMGGRAPRTVWPAPPAGVWRTALSSRFWSTRPSSGEALTKIGGSASASPTSRTPRASAPGAAPATTSDTRSPRATLLRGWSCQVRALVDAGQLDEQVVDQPAEALALLADGAEVALDRGGVVDHASPPWPRPWQGCRPAGCGGRATPRPSSPAGPTPGPVPAEQATRRGAGPSRPAPPAGG